MYLKLEYTKIRKFGLNKSSYLISIAKDQYFYWTDLKKTDKSPYTLHSCGIQCGQKHQKTVQAGRQSSPYFFDMVSVPNNVFFFHLHLLTPPPLLFRAAPPSQPPTFLKISTLVEIFNPNLQKKKGVGCRQWCQ